MKTKAFFVFELLLLLLSFLLQDNSIIHVYIYFVNISILFAFFNKYYKGWYIMILTIYIYSFPHLFNFFFLGENVLFSTMGGQYDFIANNQYINIISTRLINIFVLGLILPSFFQKRQKIIFEDETIISKKLLNSLLLIFIFLLMIALRQIDFKSVAESYSIPEGTSLVFGIYYWINFILSIFFIYHIKLNHKMTNYFIFVVFLQLILFYLGVRQMTFWFILTIVFEFLLLYKLNIIKIKFNIRLLFLGVLAVYILGIITRYRVNKEIGNELIFSFNNFSAAYMGFLAETSLTFYNLLASIYESSKGHDMFFFPQIKDTLVMFIPASLFPQKSEYLTFAIFSKSYNVNPFGTYFIVGELLLSLRYKSLMFLFGVLYNLMGHYFYLKFLRKTNILNLSIYASTLVLLFIRPVRGLLAPSFKIYITTVIFILILIKLGSYFYSSKTRMLWGQNYYK